MKGRLLITLFAFLTVGLAAQPIANSYNVVWTTQSKNSSESMPCGGGDIGMNVWVENGELLIYVARSGSFDENNALMKAGRIRIKLSPNPFDGNAFKQELHLQQGYVTITGALNGLTVKMKIWADVFSPVVHINFEANKKIDIEAAYESWRYQDRIIKARENFGNSWKWAAPKNNIYQKDVITYQNNEVLFYHQNKMETIFDATVAQQGMEVVKSKLYNPLKNLIYGGSFGGENLIRAGTYQGRYVDTDFKGWKLKSKIAADHYLLNLYLHTAQEASVPVWKQSLDSLEKATFINRKISLLKNQQWWKQFWARSLIIIDQKNTGSAAWEAGRNFALFRYMLACNAYGKWPTKFNGGLFTVDPVFTDTTQHLTPDYRNWGGGLHTAQNQRLVYFPMIKNGDWDLLQPQLDFYMRLLKNAELRSEVYWHHGGACFTEQMENYGLPDYAEYGQKRPTDFDKGVEYNNWLEYEWDTVFEFCLMMLEEQRYTGKDISSKIPFIESCLQFFDEHYQYMEKQRTGKLLDDHGKLMLYPGSAAETYKLATNSVTTISAMQTLAKRLLALPRKYADTKKRKKWQQILNRVPNLSYANFNKYVTIAPAKAWERINNTESPQLYPVFPWGIYGIGKPGLDTAINTWLYDTNVVKFRSYIGWKQDNIWAARLGLASETWRLTLLKLQNSGRRFPAFWGPGFDWVPDHNWGGSGMIGLQEMLMQTDDKKIYLFPAWPEKIDVHFKLHAPYNTVVEAEIKDKKLILLKVVPTNRKKDVEIMLYR